MKFNNWNYVNQYEYVKDIKTGGFGRIFVGKNVLNENELLAIKEVSVTSLCIIICLFSKR